MKERFLTILEVSQKQAYIFASNKLRDNIVNSATIAWIMSAEYFEKVIPDRQLFSKEKNLVYSGGGHTILEFDSMEQAVRAVKIITTQIHYDYEEIEVFAKTIEYREKDTSGKRITPGENLKRLTKELEIKKAERKSAFHQGSFGVEKINVNTLKPMREGEMEDEESKKDMPHQEEIIDKKLCPKEFHRVWEFEKLGGTKYDSSFIAIVHIDGNAMGKRVENFQKAHEHMEWEAYKKEMRTFSEAIDLDFKEAYKEMADCIAQNLKNGKLSELSLKEGDLPVRRIITAGDDICFVSEGRIGIECASVFMKALGKKKNKVDNEGYAACAGVAIVHRKYPFYKAYELAEMLCSNAKRFGASLTSDGLGREVSAIDWHIEFGEIKDTLEEIRKEYRTQDGKRLELRPYIVSASEEICKKEPVRQYANFKKLITKILNDEISYARGKMKELRSVLKKGEMPTEYFLQFHRIEDITRDSYQDVFCSLDYSRVLSGEGLERKVFVETGNEEQKEKRSVLFDAIEMLDTYLALDYEEESN